MADLINFVPSQEVIHVSSGKTPDGNTVWVTDLVEGESRTIMDISPEKPSLEALRGIYKIPVISPVLCLYLIKLLYLCCAQVPPEIEGVSSLLPLLLRYAPV
jgi:hypothetical protein